MKIETRTTMNGKPVVTVPGRILNLDSGFKHKLLCDGPTFSAGTACAYSCSFCFVPAIMRKSVVPMNLDHAHEDMVIRRATPAETLRNQLTTAKGEPKFADPNDRRVIYASPLVDVAANMELVRETVECCKVILELTNWQIRLLSKSNLLPQIATSLGPWSCATGHRSRERIIYGVSTGTLDDRLAAAFEQGCPLVSKRIQSLHWLQDNGFRTFGMICPSLPQPAASYRKFAAEMYQAIRGDRCEHIWAEVINVRGDSFTRTLDALLRTGFKDEASALRTVSEKPAAWEQYAKDTFIGHAAEVPLKKLRFLQYVNRSNIGWWKKWSSNGAVLLGQITNNDNQQNEN